MKSNAKQEKKSQTALELTTELRQTREKLFKLQWKRRAAPLANPMELRTLRRQAARLETWLRQKKAAETARAN